MNGFNNMCIDFLQKLYSNPHDIYWISSLWKPMHHNQVTYCWTVCWLWMYYGIFFVTKRRTIFFYTKFVLVLWERLVFLCDGVLYIFGTFCYSLMLHPSVMSSCHFDIFCDINLRISWWRVLYAFFVGFFFYTST